jgi:hypothetical protein
VAFVIDPYTTCEKCGGDGYQPVPFTRSLYRFPCKGCKGTGMRERAISRIWRILRHGAKAVSEGEY